MSIQTVNRETSGDGTLGHSLVHGGLRGHSIGDIYPISVVAVGAFPVTWGAFDCRNGKTGTLWEDIDLAYRDAQFYKLIGGV